MMFLVPRARIYERLWNPRIDSATYVSLAAGTFNRVVVPALQTGNRFLGSLKGLQIRALSFIYSNVKTPCLFGHQRRSVFL